MIERLKYDNGFQEYEEVKALQNLELKLKERIEKAVKVDGKQEALQDILQGVLQEVLQEVKQQGKEIAKGEDKKIGYQYESFREVEIEEVKADHIKEDIKVEKVYGEEVNIAEVMIEDRKTGEDKEILKEEIKEEKVKEEKSIKVSATMEREEEEGAPIAKNFFLNYPRIYPFEDNEITQCVKIEPKDIGHLPKEYWEYSSNSFLMHGYYCYHHLIFAKKKQGRGYEYILGIPGIYHNKEEIMAQMFGFELFKPIKKRELKQGDFGYWYITISL